MLFRMITPRVSKSRSTTIRKGIPKDVRAEYQRLYGQRWEAKLTLPAGMKPQEAKVRLSEFSAEVESRIEAIRAARRGVGQSLTQRQAFALAGEWYVGYVAQHEENPGTVEHWRVIWDVLIHRLEDHAPDWVIEEGWRDLEWTKEPEVRAGVRPLISDEAKTAQFLASKGVVLNTEAQALFLDCVLDEFMAAILLLGTPCQQGLQRRYAARRVSKIRWKEDYATHQQDKPVAAVRGMGEGKTTRSVWRRTMADRVSRP
jgi:hypothetical protein